MFHAPCSTEHGFTLIEMLIVVAIVAVLTIVGVSNYFGARTEQILENQMDELVADIRWTAERSRAQENGEQWGVHFENPSGDNNDFYSVWYGSSYASGTVASTKYLSTGLSFTNPASSSTKDVVFLKATGLPTASSTIVIESVESGSTGTVDIDVNGKVGYTLS